jgi:hypothetical protein
MQPVTKKELEDFVVQAEQAGKEVTDLRNALETMADLSPPAGQRIEKTTEHGFTIIESTGPAREDDFEDVKVEHKSSDTQNAKEDEVAYLTPAGEVPKSLSGTGFSYRHDWGDKNGQWKLNLNWGAIRANSRVFVAIAEGAPGGGKFLGSARYTLHNVAPSNGGVSIWVNIEWNSPIRLYVDYLVVNP